MGNCSEKNKFTLKAEKGLQHSTENVFPDQFTKRI